MTVTRLLAETTSRELTEWHALFSLKQHESSTQNVEEDIRKVFGKKRKP